MPDATASLKKPIRTCAFCAGFSLLELILVMAVAAILAAVAIPVAINLQRSTNITRTGQLIQGKLKLARQTALTRNRYVEVRFFKTPSHSTSGNVYNALQLFIYDDKAVVATQLDKLTFFPDGIVASTVTGYSTILDSPTRTGTQSLPSLGGSTYSYKGFCFKDGGGTDLAPTDSSGNPLLWFVTVSYESDPATGAKPPKNYYTVQVDPVLGETVSFRP